MDIQKLLNEKQKMLLLIEKNLKTWDNSYEHALDLLETNEKFFNQLRELDQYIPSEEIKKQNFQLSDRLRNIVRLQKELSDSVQKEQIAIQERIEQISKKQKVVSNYISLQNNSIFVEKEY